MARSKLLIIAPLPPPLTGQSIAVELLIKNIGAHTSTFVVDTSKSDFHQGASSLLRLCQVVKLLVKVLSKIGSSDKIYFNCSQSIAGNLRDLLIYAFCWQSLGRMVIHLHGGAGMRVLLSENHPVLLALNRFFLKRVGAVVVLGERLKSIYDGVVPSDRLHAVPNFAGDEFFVDTSIVDSKFSDVEPLRLLFLSNLLPGKGHQELLAALALLPAEVKGKLQVDFAGGFESKDEEFAFKQAVEKTGGAAINVRGVVQGELKKELLRRAHLFCLPTYYPYEGQPISILEAYASACAVMTTNHSGIFDTFTPGVNGFEVEPKSPQSIADAILSAVHNAPKLKDYGKNNLEEAQRKYRASTYVAALEKIIF